MRRMMSRAILLTVGLGMAAVAVAEEVTVVTYMPAPTGRFDQMETRNTTGLAAEGGSVVIGASKPAQGQQNELLIIASDAQPPSGGACPYGYTFYDENGNGTPDDDNECKQTVLTVNKAGRIDLRRIRVVRNGKAPIRLVSFSDAGKGILQFDRARGNRDAPDVVQEGDHLGVLRFRGFNPLNSDAADEDDDDTPAEGDYKYGISAIMRAVVDGPVGVDDVPGRLMFLTHEAGTAPGGVTERMRIANNGNVGIGTASKPKGLLHLERERNATLRLRSYHDAGKPQIIFDRARGTRSAPASVQDGTALGHIKFRGFHPAATDPDPDDPNDTDDPVVGDFSYGISASIKAAADGPVGVDDVPGRLTFLTHEAGTGPGGLTERLRIDSNGRVGIGTTDLEGRLRVHHDAGQSQIHISGVSDGGLTYSVLYLDDSTADYRDDWAIGHKKMTGTPEAEALHFAHWDSAGAGLVAMALQPNGRVGIGTVDPSAQLHVVGDVKIDGNLTMGSTNTIDCLACLPTPLSDARLKANMMPLTDVLAKLDGVRVISYEWNNTATALGLPAGTREIGVTAQDVEAVFPEFVKTTGSGYKGVDYARLAAVLIEAVKELRAENQQLRQRIERLEQQ